MKANFTQPNGTTKELNQKSEISRRQFLSLLPTLGVTLACSACGVVPKPPTGELSASEGYSIFRETMVEMPWPEVKKAAEEGAIVLLPIAVVEEHGPHMGLGADTYLTYLWSKFTCRALRAKGIKTLIAPPYYWGVNVTTGSIPGSFTVREETMKAILYDIHASLQQWGFTDVFSLNLHGDASHRRILQEAINEIQDKLGMGAHNIVAPPLSPEGDVSLARDFHAGAFETAWMVTEFPDDVDVELAKTLEPHFEFTPPGYYGEPAKFEMLPREEMKKWQESFAAATADRIENVLKKK